MDEKPDDENNLVSKVRGWLDKQGYPLEMRIARLFQDAAFDVQQSEYYESVEGKSREIDVAARLGLAELVPGAESTLYFDLFVTCECKTSARSKRPWVVFSSPKNRLGPFGHVLERPTSKLGASLLSMAHTDSKIHEHPLFKLSERCGYSVSNPSLGSGSSGKDSNLDPAYGALASIAGAAHAKSKTISEPPFALCRVTLPVIVVGTPLFECWLDEKGEVRLEERQEMTVIWRNRIGTAQNTIIQILHEQAVPAYVARVESAFKVFQKHHRPHMRMALTAEEKEAKKGTAATSA